MKLWVYPTGMEFNPSDVGCDHPAWSGDHRGECASCGLDGEALVGAEERPCYEERPMDGFHVLKKTFLMMAVIFLFFNCV